MSLTFVNPQNLVGKVIKKVDSKSFNAWNIYFKDGTSVTLDTESGPAGIPALVLYGKIIEKKDPRAATSRPRGAVGKDPLVYKVFRDLYTPRLCKNLAVLDYGAGVDAVHTQALRKQGYHSVFAYDLPENSKDYANPGIYGDPDALLWNVVLLSNVLNVQTSFKAIYDILRHVHHSMSDHGVVILNYPKSPRKSKVTPNQLKALVSKIFNPSQISLVAGTVSAPCMVVTF